MATKISCASGNWTEPSTWAVCDPTAESDSMASAVAVSTSYQASSNFTTGAVTVDGVAVNFYGVGAISAITGTLSVKLYNATDLTDVAGTETTVNVADIFSNDGTTVTLPGWRFIKFAAPVTLIAGKAYNLQIKRSSSTSSLSVYVTAGTNWSRQLRTTTTAAPAAGDKLFVLGELTGPGTGNDITVTMDNNDSTDYGGGSTTTPSLCVGKRGTLTWKTDANTQLKLSGLFWIGDGGTVLVGDDGNRVGSAYTASIIFDCAAAGDFGFKVYGGTLKTRGATKVTQTLLTADVAAGATALTVRDVTNWSNGDDIAIGTTNRTRTECERRTVSSASGNTVNITSSLTYAHSGVDYHAAPIANVTRNVKIGATSASYPAYIHVTESGTFDAEYTEFYYLGANAAYKYGITTYHRATTFRAVGCAFRDFQASIRIVNLESSNYTNLTVTNCTAGYCANAGIYMAYDSTAPSPTITLQDNCMISCGSGGGHSIFYIRMCGSANCVVQRNRVCGCNLDFTLVNPINAKFNSVVEDNVCLGGGSYGMVLVIGGGMGSGRFRNNVTGFNSAGGFNTGSSTQLITIDNHFSFGEMPIANAHGYGVFFRNLRTSGFVKGGFSYTSFAATSNSYNQVLLEYFKDCEFGHQDGYYTNHSYAVSLGNLQFAMVFLDNCIVNPSTVVYNQNASMLEPSFVYSRNHNRQQGEHNAWVRDGRLSTDSTIFCGAAPSTRLTPNLATNRLKSFFGGDVFGFSAGKFQVAVKNGESATVSVKVRESVAGDGTDYDGQRVRLFLEGHPALQYEHVTNGSFTTDTSGWTTAGGATLSSVSGGVSGNCLRISTGGAGAQARQAITTVPGTTYVVTAWMKPGSTDGCALLVGTTAGAGDLATSETSKETTVWRAVVLRFVATGTTTYLSLCDMGTAEGITTHFDEVSVVNVSEDTVLATATAASEGNWETLTGVVGPVYADCVLSFYVDCGGTGYTQGWVNVDDWDATPKNDTKGERFWPHLVGDNATAGTGGGGRAFGYIGG